MNELHQTSDFEVLEIQSMTDRHILNTIKLIDKWTDRIENKTKLPHEEKGKRIEALRERMGYYHYTLERDNRKSIGNWFSNEIITSELDELNKKG